MPHLYLWKSAKWVSGITLSTTDEPGFWESRLPQLRRPVARAAVLGRLTWRVGDRGRGAGEETATARTLVLDVPGWPGHVAGQHVDVRLTAPDGYTAVRSYSMASAPEGERVEVTVEPVADGEVSPYLAEVLTVGDPVEVRGPVGGWFVWRPEQTEPVQLVGRRLGDGAADGDACGLGARRSAAQRAVAAALLACANRRPVLYGAELATARGAGDGLRG